MLSDLLLRLRSLVRRRAVEAELDDELRFHREHQLERYLAAGISPADARRRMTLEFGELEQVKDACRQARGVHIVENFFQDLRYGWRSLLKTPSFTVVAVLTLALGLGATTAIFSVVYGVLLRPLPFTDPAGLVVMNETTPKVGLVSVSYPNFLDWRAQSREFETLAVVNDLSVNVSGTSQPEAIDAKAVSSNYLAMLGVKPLLGRDFEPAEDRAGTAPVALLTYPLWQSHFGGAHDVLGRSIDLDGRPVTIVGVLPPEFRTADMASLLMPVGVWATGNDSVTERGSRGDCVVIGRLARGATLTQARTEMDGIAARLARAYPAADDGFGVSLRPLRDVFVGEVRPALLVLLGAVACVLLIACANVANLCLIRGAGRTREIALRMAIGAGRGRIVGQLLVESMLLAALGGTLGLGIAAAGIRALAWIVPMDTLGGASVALNGPVLAFAALAVLVSTIVFGLTPALQSAKPDVHAELKEGGRTGSSGARQQRWRVALTVIELAFAVILLVGAGLMMKSLSRLLAVDLGVRTDHVLTMRVDLKTPRYENDAAVAAFWQRVLDGTRALPGVESAALGSAVPLTNGHSRVDITIEGAPLPRPGAFPHPDVHIVTPGYVDTLGVRLIRGRAFTDADTEQAPKVALVNRQLADRFYGRENPIGRHFMVGRLRPGSTTPPDWITIVGVVGDTRLYGLDNPARLEIYLPLRQDERDGLTILARSAIDPEALTSAIRAVVASVDRDQPISDIATMSALVESDVETRRMTFVLLGLFSALALVLAAIGVYGVMSYAIAQRTQELGIRMALGAQRFDVLKTILAQGLTIAASGILVGIAASAGLARLMSTLLFGVSAADPPTFAVVSIGLALVALIACYVPGRRAVRLDPLIALRRD